jgi:hypothetical protein
VRNINNAGQMLQEGPKKLLSHKQRPGSTQEPCDEHESTLSHSAQFSKKLLSGKLKEHDGPKNVELHKQCPVALQTPLPLQVSDDVQTET